MSRADRAERLLDLVSFLLAAHEPASLEAIMEAFPADWGEGSPEARARRFERDKAELLDLGIPIEWVPPSGDEPGGYRIRRDQYYLRDLRLDPDELALLTMAGGAALRQPDFPLRTDLAHALDKLLFVRRVPSRRAAHLRLQAPAVVGERQAGVLQALGRAVAARKDVQLRYRSFRGEVTERRVSPYGLAYRRGAWFLVGHCRLRDDLRIFQAERVLALEVNSRAARTPDFEVPPGFDVAAHVGREPWAFGAHPPVEVELALDAHVAPLARSRFGAEGRAAGGGAVRLSVRATNRDALVREVLRLAPHAEVLGPAALRAEVAARAAAIGARHGAPPRRLETRAPAGESAPAVAGLPSHELQERLRRALLLVPYVVSRGGCTVEELASVLRIAPERVLEEIDFLRLVGRPPFSPAELVDLDVVDGRVQVFLPQGLQRPPSLTPLEAAALDAAASALEAEGGESLARARQKLRAALPELSRPTFDAVAGRVRVAAAGLDPEVARLLDRAIDERREVELTYVSASRIEASRRTVRPLERVLHQGYWYLHGWCCEREDLRLFRLDRASDLALSERTFEPPEPERERLAGGMLFEPGPHARVAELRLSPGPYATPEQAARLGASAVAEAEDGTLVAELPVDGAAYVLSLALALGEAAELAAPADLRAEVAALADAVARLHG